jgi:hypothetical protein
LYFTTDKIIASKSKDAEKKDKKEKKEINETNETNELIRSAMVGSIGKIKNLVLDYGLYLDTKGKLTKLGDEESLTMAIALGKQFENYLEHAASDEKFKSLSSHFADIASNHPVKLSKSTSPRHSVSANSQSSSALLQNEGSESKESRKGHFRTRSRSVGDLASQKMQTPKVLKSQLPVRQKLTSVPEATSIATDTALKSFSDDEGRSAKRNRTRYSLPINGAPGMTSYLAASLVRNLSGGESNRTSSAKSSLPINGAPETTSYLAASLVRSLSGGESNRTSSAESKNDRYSSMSVKEKQKFFEDQVSAKAESKNTV